MWGGLMGRNFRSCNPNLHLVVLLLPHTKSNSLNLNRWSVVVLAEITLVSTRNKPTCGCIGPASIQGAKRNHYCALFHAGIDPGKYRETMLTLGKYHCRDIHEWEGGYCSFHPLSKCSCKKCDAQSGTKPLEKIHKTHIFNLNVGKQRVKTVSHTPPPYNVAHGWNFSFNIEWGRRGLGILHEQPICEK